MLVEAGGGRPSDPHPPISSWSPEVELLADIADELKALRTVLIAVNSEKGRAPKLKPTPRPRTMLDKVRASHRRAKHETLANRVLMRRQKKT